jgi:hypothetical protein
MGLKQTELRAIVEVTRYYVDVLERNARNADKEARKNPELNAFYKGKAEAFYATMRFLLREIMYTSQLIENESEN